MKKKYILSILIAWSASAAAQTDPDTAWKKGGFIGINFSQVAIGTDWQQGGESSMSIAGNVKLFANYAKGKTEWSNDLVMNYAMVNTKTNGVTKSDDRIDLNSKLSRKLSDKWLFSVLLNFKTQFAPGYNYPNDSIKLSDFFAPAYLTIGPGFTYKPVEYFEAFISPATAKFTFVNDQTLSDAGAYGVKPGEKVFSEFGAYLNMKFKKEILKNVTLSSRLELFNNYTDEDKDNAKKIDVYWDTYLDMKINNYLTASVNYLLIYDANVIERTQTKEMLGIGLGYKFGYVPPEKK